VLEQSFAGHLSDLIQYRKKKHEHHLSICLSPVTPVAEFVDLTILELFLAKFEL